MELSEIIRGLGLDPERVPVGQMGLAWADDYRNLSDRAAIFAKNPDNDPCIVYRVDREFDHAGIILRNLHERPRGQHVMVLDESTKDIEGPYFHNLEPALPLIWETGVVVACEGPKDARALHQYGVPGVAYLGPVPSQEWLTILYRYAGTLLWMPDNDIEYKPSHQWVRHKHLQMAQKIGFRVRIINLKCKDAGELYRYPDEIERVRRIFSDTVMLQGKRAR